MSETTRPRPTMRASDADREEIAQVLQRALADGRLTAAEADERLASCYATKYQPELAVLVEDLPADRPAAPPAGGGRPGRMVPPLAGHAAIVVLLSGLLIARWAAMPAAFGDERVFWPIFPIFWLMVSLVVHVRIRGARAARGR